MIGRLVRSTDFERVLRTRSRASSAHFAIHHVADVPATGRRQPVATKLSTDLAPDAHTPVDRSPETVPGGVWIGAVVPKRHARRAVTRTLLKRQIRSVADARVAELPDGLWVVRLRAPFDRTTFPSAASPALKLQARAELEQVLQQAVARRVGR